MIQTRDCLGEFGEDDYPHCRVIGNIDWDGFINNFMKKIHIIEINPKGYNGGIFTCLHLYLYKPHESRIFPPQT